MSKGLAPCHRNVEGQFPCIWGWRGYPLSITITALQYNTKGLDPSTIRVQPCVMSLIVQLAGERLNSVSPRGCDCPCNTSGNSRGFCATRGGSLSSVMQKSFPACWVCPLGLKSL